MNKQTAQLLEKHFDIALETPDGVKKLRELILTLAMQGELVKQDPKDQPARELLDLIDAEKKRLYKVGKIKKLDLLPEIKQGDITYPAPKGWVWCNICAISFKVTDGEHITPQRSSSGYFLLSARNVTNEGILLDDVDFVLKDEFERIRKRCDPEIGDILISCSGSVGRIAIVDNDEYVMVRSAAVVKHAHEFVNSLFLAYSLRSPMAQLQIIQKSKTTAQSNLFIGKIKEILIPLPPLAEQKRIVAKIDQLMALCDKLETERNERNAKRLAIHTSAINSLLTAKDKTVFNSSWKFITKNFSELYSVQDNVEELKKAILQLAVMGKLVPQEPKDQPAGELLKEIETEKKRLLKEGLIKKQELLPLNKLAEVPYILPKNWEWCRIKEICHDWGQKTPDKKFTYIDVGAIDNTKGAITSNVQLLDSSEAPSRARKIVKNGTVIYSTVRPYLLNIAILEEDYSHEPIASTAFAILHPYDGILNRYVYYYLHSNPFIDYVNLQMKGVAYPAINDGNFFQGPFPLPPIAEQKRIVAKIDQLMSLCNSLVQQVNSSTDKQTAILNAVLAKI